MKYRTVAPQEDGWSDWIVPTDKELRIVCCDCKLAHDFEFKVVNGEVAFRARRNDSETARLRGGREQAAEICRRYLAGESQRELAAAFGCSQKAIQNTLRCGGVKARSNSEACMLREGKKVRSCAPRRLTPAQVVEVGRRYVRGETESSLAAAFDCHRREIGRALAILKIEKRSFAEVCALRGQKQRKPQASRSSKSVQRSAGSAPVGQDPGFAALDAIIMAERRRIGLGR